MQLVVILAYACVIIRDLSIKWDFINILPFLGVLHYLQMLELSKLIRELKSILYGNSESEPVSEACAQLTQEFFKENTLRLLIICLPKLNLEVSINRLSY